jgi:hypothetical protein
MGVMRRSPSRSGRGGAVVEFAVACGLLLTSVAGVWQLGYAFYVYNQLESAVRNGARYGSVATYDGSGFQVKVRNMVVYGNVNPTSSDRRLVPGLTPENVRITLVFNGAVAKQVQVDIVNYRIDTLFVEFPLSGKPRCTFEYMGRFVVPA